MLLLTHQCAVKWFKTVMKFEPTPLSFQWPGETPQCHVLPGVSVSHVCGYRAVPGLEAVLHPHQSHSRHKVYRRLTSEMKLLF